jgi:hypothetical protein
MAAVLGEALTGIYSTPGGTAQLFERGVVVTGAAGPVAVEFAFPMIGRPHIATDTASAGTATALRPEAVTFRRGGHDINVLGPLVRAALAGRVAVVPTGQASAPQVLTAGPVEIVEPERPTGVGGTVVPAVYGVSLTGPLRERQLYDVALAADPGAGGSRPPTRSTTAGCGTTSGSPTHVTDAHVARRIDRFRPTLYNLGRPEAAARMYNWNDRFRGFVRYANYLPAIGGIGRHPGHRGHVRLPVRVRRRRQRPRQRPVPARPPPGPGPGPGLSGCRGAAGADLHGAGQPRLQEVPLPPVL